VWKCQSEVGVVVIVVPKRRPCGAVLVPLVLGADGTAVGEHAVLPDSQPHRLLRVIRHGHAGVPVAGGAADVVALPVVRVRELDVADAVAGGRGRVRICNGRVGEPGVPPGEQDGRRRRARHGAHRTEDGKRVDEGRVTAHLTQAGNRARALDGAGVVVVRVDGAGGVAELVLEVGADEAWQIEENHGSGHGVRKEGDDEQGKRRVVLGR
jgi:hypothetical protein